MTTDTKFKECAVEFTLGGKVCHMGTMCKGSGMIHINLGTMLSFITTDCAISPAMIEKALRELDWEPDLTCDRTVGQVVDFFRAQQAGEPERSICMRQVSDFYERRIQ